jgi:hypothetical protein
MIIGTIITIVKRGGKIKLIHREAGTGELAAPNHAFLIEKNRKNRGKKHFLLDKNDNDYYYYYSYGSV